MDLNDLPIHYSKGVPPGVIYVGHFGNAGDYPEFYELLGENEAEVPNVVAIHMAPPTEDD